MKIIPFWKLQTKKQFGLSIGFICTRFDYLASGSFWSIQLDLLVIRIIF